MSSSMRISSRAIRLARRRRAGLTARQRRGLARLRLGADGLVLDRPQALGGTPFAPRRVERLLLAIEPRVGGVAFGARRIDAGRDDEALVALGKLAFVGGIDRGALGTDARLRDRLVGGLLRRRHHGSAERQRARQRPPSQPGLHHVSEVSTSRRGLAMNSADCISRRRDTVRGNSCTSGPSV